MARVFKTRHFQRWMRKSGLTDVALCNAVFGFEKSARANITTDELEGLKALATDLLSRTGKELDEAVLVGALQEICHDEKSQDP